MAKSVTVLELLQSKKINIKFIGVAHNGTVLQKEDYKTTLLKDGDAIEIVRPVGGG
jgi:thiamine biosynthesis protein ThiS